MQIGVTFNFSKYVGLDQAFTLYPQKYQEYQEYPKNIWNLATPKYFPNLYFDHKKTQIDRNVSPKRKKNNFIIPPNIFIYLTFPTHPPLQKMQFKILNLQKWTEPTYIW